MSIVLAIVLALAFFLTLGCVMWRIERRIWNDGICAESGRAWELFDTDSSGGRGFTDGDSNYCWLGWFKPSLTTGDKA